MLTNQYRTFTVFSTNRLVYSFSINDVVAKGHYDLEFHKLTRIGKWDNSCYVLTTVNKTGIIPDEQGILDEQGRL